MWLMGAAKFVANAMAAAVPRNLATGTNTLGYYSSTKKTFQLKTVRKSRAFKMRHCN
jgi:hypothetical protein